MGARSSGRVARGLFAADPLDRWSRLALAENYRRMGRPDDAESAIGTLANDDPEAIALRGRIALDLQDHDEARRLLRWARPINPFLARLRGTLALGRRDVTHALATSGSLMLPTLRVARHFSG